VWGGGTVKVVKRVFHLQHTLNDTL